MNKPIFILLATLLFLAACSGTANSPKGVAERFLNFVSKGEYEKAKELGTASTAMYLDFSRQMMPENFDKKFEFKILRDSIVDDHAWVFFYDGRTEKEELLDMVKIDKQWKVDLQMHK